MSRSDGIGERLDALSPERRALLEALRAEGRPSATGIRRRDPGEPVTLSFAQRRLWFLDQLASGNPFYNIPLAVRLPAPLSAPLLERSINEIVCRHESLRTTFESRDGEPLAVIAPALHVPLSTVNLRSLPAESREAESVRLATLEAQQPFDLERGPLIRTTLLELTDFEQVFLLSLHHIIGDGWSAGIFFQELSAIYPAFAIGRVSPLPELPLQYGDFAVWQKRWLSPDVLREQLGYWKQQLAELPTLNLATDRPRPPLKAFRGAVHRFTVDVPLTREIKALSRRESVTLFMTLLAAFQILLHRYTSQSDVVVGSMISNRTRRELEPLIGFFVNSLVLRTDLSGDPTFIDLLQRVRATALAAYDHQDIPFELVVEELQPARDPSRNPLFQVTFQLFTPQGAKGPAQPSVAVQRGTAIFDLACTVVETADRLEGNFEYDTDLFDAETIARLVDHMNTLLEGVVADPRRPLSAFPLMTADERARMTDGWTTTEYPMSYLDALYDEAVAATPDAVAVVSDDGLLSYRKLDERANAVAVYLQDLGIGSDDLVAVCLERSRDLVVGLLGILKAGAAYVPLDAGNPPHRLEKILQDSGARIVLTHSRLRHLLGSVCALALDGDWLAIASVGSRRPNENGRSMEDLAYVIYTSGSTGQPKGVMVPHRAIVNHMRWMQDRFALTPLDGVLQRTSPGFDASVWEFFAPLMAGARLVISGPDAQRDATALVRAVREHGITVLQVVPSLLELFLEEPGVQQLATLRRVFCGGEPLLPGVVNRFHDRLKHVELCNLYGPTEAAIDSTYWVSDGPSDRAVVPIGRPITNVDAYVLDERREVVPAGVPGELYIGGAGLARGYLLQEALTAERFVAHPFRAGALLYKTGDIARYRHDGLIEFLGRHDHQVKLRGYRIELGEIEATLRQHAVVRDAIVLCREDQPGDRKLVAYVACGGDRDERDVDLTLRRHLQLHLPGQMVPATVVVLDALPLMPNGKVDRRALPAPDAAAPRRERTFVAPRTTIEETMARIWGDVLRVRPVGVHDNFFMDLGGHSLLGTQLMSRIKTAFGVDLPLLRLFEGPTIAELTDHLSEAMNGAAVVGSAVANDTELMPIDPDALSAADRALIARAMTARQEGQI